MAEKKYYWLKLRRDFFKRHDIRIIEEMPNGKDYILFYLKLLLESIDHEGELRFSEAIPYNEQMLSVITNTNIDIVKAAMAIFTELNMVELYDDRTIYMNEAQKLIGSETADAERKRRARKSQKQLPNTNGSGQIPDNVQKCPTEIDIDKDLDLDKENREKSYKKIADLFNFLCPSLNPVKYLSEETKNQIEAQLTKYSIDDFKLLFEKVESSDFLKGENEKKWTASFEWLIKDQNMAKVLNGNYDNAEPTVVSNFGGYSHEELERLSRGESVHIKGNPELEREAAELRETLQEAYS